MMVMKMIKMVKAALQAMRGSSADKAVTRSSVVGSSIGQHVVSSDCARDWTEAN